MMYRKTFLKQCTEILFILFKDFKLFNQLRCLNEKKNNFLKLYNKTACLFIFRYILLCIYIFNTLHNITDIEGSHCRDI